MLARPTGRPIAAPADELWTMKLANTSSSTCPAVIATNRRRPRLNGRTMNDTNSIGAMNGLIGQGVPCGTNSEKKCSLWRQKPTTRTIEKNSTASTQAMENGHVTVRGCRPTCHPHGLRVGEKMVGTGRHGRATHQQKKK